MNNSTPFGRSPFGQSPPLSGLSGGLGALGTTAAAAAAQQQQQQQHDSAAAFAGAAFGGITGMGGVSAPSRPLSVAAALGNNTSNTTAGNGLLHSAAAGSPPGGVGVGGISNMSSSSNAVPITINSNSSNPPPSVGGGGSSSAFNTTNTATNVTTMSHHHQPSSLVGGLGMGMGLPPLASSLPTVAGGGGGSLLSHPAAANTNANGLGRHAQHSSLDNLLAAAQYQGHLKYTAAATAAAASPTPITVVPNTNNNTNANTNTTVTNSSFGNNIAGVGYNQSQDSMLLAGGGGITTPYASSTAAPSPFTGHHQQQQTLYSRYNPTLHSLGSSPSNTMTHTGAPNSLAATHIPMPLVGGASSSPAGLAGGGGGAAVGNNSGLLSGSAPFGVSPPFNSATTVAGGFAGTMKPSPTSAASPSAAANASAAATAAAIADSNYAKADVFMNSNLQQQGTGAGVGGSNPLDGGNNGRGGAQQQQQQLNNNTSANNNNNNIDYTNNAGGIGMSSGGRPLARSMANDVILQQLPTSPLLYVLVTSEGRDKSFKLLQYFIKLMISVLNLKGVIPNQMETASDYWSHRLAQNVQTVRNGRSMFKLGRWLVTCLHLQTCIERLKSQRLHEEAMAQIVEETMFQQQRVEEGAADEDALDFALAIAAEKEMAAAAGLTTASASAAVHSPTALGPCALCIAAGAANGVVGSGHQSNTSTSTPRRVSAGASAGPSTPQRSGGVGVGGATPSPMMGPAGSTALLPPSAANHDAINGAADSQATTPTARAVRTSFWAPEMPRSSSSPTSHHRKDASSGANSNATTPRSAAMTSAATSEAAAGAVIPIAACEHHHHLAGVSGGGDVSGADVSTTSPTLAAAAAAAQPTTSGGTPHVSPATAAAVAAIAAIEETVNATNPHNLHPTCHAGGRVVRFTNSYQLAVFQPAEDAQCKNWRRSIVDFPRWGMYLMIIRCITSIIRNLFRDCLYMGEKALFGFSRSKAEEIKTLWNTVTLGRRNSLQIIADLSWLVMSFIDLCLNTRRLCQRAWIATALHWDADYYCQCNLSIDVDDGEVIWAHIDPNYTRRVEDVGYPKLDFDFGSVTPTSAKYWEAANPANLKLCCTRCGCLLQKVPKGDEIPKELINGEWSRKRNRMHVGGGGVGSGAAAAAAADADGDDDEEGEEVRQVMAFPFFVRKCLNVLSCCVNNPNLRHTILLQVRYICDVYLAYGFVFKDHFKSLPVDKKYLQHVNMLQAIAGMTSSYVALQRVLQSAK